MYTFTTNGKTVSIFPSSEANAPIIYLNTFSGEGQKVYEAAQAAGCPPFTLVAIRRQRKSLAEFLAGGASPDILWPGCLPSTPSTRRICFPGWAACPAPSGFPA